MEYLIYGFEMDLGKYDLKEIFVWILVHGILNFLAGNFIAKRKIQNRYYYLIRQGSFSRWWYRLSASVLVSSVVWVVMLFAGVSVFQMIVWKEACNDIVKFQIGQAFFMCVLNFCFMNTIQLLVINIKNGEKISFLVITVIEILSLYSGNLLGKIGCWLPGNFSMYNRSSFFAESGYNVYITSVVQLVCIAACVLIGHKKMIGRN